jgi:RluA family pseudouridine synthase
VAKPPHIELANGMRIPILYEDRNVIAIDKPQGWMLAPVSWQNTSRNLFAALTSSVSAGDFWARSRNLKFIRFVHRLDAETSGVLLLVKASGAVPAYTELFEDRKVRKVYLAVVQGVPEVVEWKCRLRVAPTAERAGVMEINNAQGKDSETLFRVIDQRAGRALVMCWPLTGRTHQIRLHLAAVGHPVLGDELYGGAATADRKAETKLALRSLCLAYKDPFMAEQVEIVADGQSFVKGYGFDGGNRALQNTKAPAAALEHPKARFEDLRRVEKETRQQQRAARRPEKQDWPGRPPIHRGPPPAHGFREQPAEMPRHARRDAPYERASGDVGVRPGRPYEDRSRRFDRPFRRPRQANDDRARGFGDRPPRRPGLGGRPFGKPPDSADRGEGRAYGPRRGFDRPARAGDARGERLKSRAEVFQSSAKAGLKSGFQASGFGPGPRRRPFRAAAGGHSQGKGTFGGGHGFGGTHGHKRQRGEATLGRKPGGRAQRTFSKNQ